MQLQIELTALKKDKGEAAKTRRDEIERHIDELQAQADKLEKTWRYEKDIIDELNDTSEKLERAKTQLELAERGGDLALAGRIKYGDMPEYNETIAQLRSRLNTIPPKERLLRDEVTADDIAAVVARWTGIPVDRLVESETEKLAHLEDTLEQRVVGQRPAVEAVANAIRRARAGIGDQNRPIGSFLFLGPTGVGKTELAKALAAVLFSDERAMTRIDMSEYMEQHAVARLIGSPPGYVGYEEGGQLTEAVRRRPYSIVLLDEVEKAHPDVFNVLLQVLDDGRLTDGQGRTVNFNNTVIIMTSNIGSTFIQEWAGKDRLALEQQLKAELNKRFRPEFINRVDDIVVFDRISQEHMANIVDLQLAQTAALIKKSKDITLNFGDTLRQALASEGYDPAYGARPLKRLIQNMVLNPLASRIIDGSITEGSNITVGFTKRQVTFSHKNT